MKATTKGEALMSNRIEVLDVALELIRAVRPIVRKIQTQDAEEARQMKTAANSVARNVSEGWERIGKDKPHLYRIAAGSAREVRAGLLIADAWGWVEPAEMDDAMSLCDRLGAMLWRLTH
jgi:four helix bundle protein